MNPRTNPVRLLVSLGTILVLAVTAIVLLDGEPDRAPSPEDRTITATGRGNPIDDARAPVALDPAERRVAAEDLGSSTLARIAELATLLDVDSTAESALI